MKKTKSISDLVTDLQNENENLQIFKKLFDKACKAEFGYDMKAIHQMIDKQKLFELRKAEEQKLQDIHSTYENQC
jgi:hypothetical protein